MSKDIWSAVGRIGDDLVFAADKDNVKEYFKQKKQRLWLKYASIAACFVLVVCAVVAVPSIIKITNDMQNREASPPYDAQLEIVCTNGKLIFSRIATTPRVWVEMSNPDKTVKVFEDKHDIISALYHAMDGKEAIGAVELTPSYQLLLSGQTDEEPWHYLLEISTDGDVRISNNGELLCYIQISEEELQSILQILN